MATTYISSRWLQWRIGWHGDGGRCSEGGRSVFLHVRPSASCRASQRRDSRDVVTSSSSRSAFSEHYPESTFMFAHSCRSGFTCILLRNGSFAACSGESPSTPPVDFAVGRIRALRRPQRRRRHSPWQGWASFCAVFRVSPLFPLGACLASSARFVGPFLRMQQRWSGCCRAYSSHHYGPVQLVSSFQVFFMVH